jgi:hypothetical protein
VGFSRKLTRAITLAVAKVEVARQDFPRELSGSDCVAKLREICDTQLKHPVEGMRQAGADLAWANAMTQPWRTKR